MAQDTRKDPRAKVLSMTVRYKSATVDEFIQHHAHDVSRGGIYIKTPSPFPPGTLLKFEIRIQDEQSVLAGVGRVVWKREADQATPESPAGMGVKFIKIDDKSKGIIARLVDAQGGGISAYDRGHPGGAEAEAAKAPAAEKAADKTKRASTMLGLGAIGAAEVLKAAESAKADAAGETASEPEKSGEAGGFFPKSSTEEADQRPPEERTVMKQAAELLQQALSEAGGSLGELDAPPAADKAAEPEKPAAKTSEPPKAETKPAADKPAEAKPAAKPAAEKPAAAAKTKEAAPAKPVAKTEPSKSAAEKPAPVSARAEPVEEPSNSGKLVLGLAIAALVAGGAYFLLAGDDSKPPAGTPTVTASAKPSAAPTVTATASAVPTAEPTPTAEPAASAEPSAVPSSEPSAAPTAEPTAEPTAKPTAEPPPPPATTQKPPPPPPPATTQKPPPPPPPPGDDIYG